MQRPQSHRHYQFWSELHCRRVLWRHCRPASRHIQPAWSRPCCQHQVPANLQYTSLARSSLCRSIRCPNCAWLATTFLCCFNSRQQPGQAEAARPACRTAPAGHVPPHTHTPCRTPNAVSAAHNCQTSVCLCRVWPVNSASICLQSQC